MSYIAYSIVHAKPLTKPATMAQMESLLYLSFSLSALRRLLLLGKWYRRKNPQSPYYLAVFRCTLIVPPVIAH